MIREINGSIYLELIQYGIRNLELHRSRLNELNVFPVPDGDTGTNMVMTLRYGAEAVGGAGSERLSELSARFSSSAVFGARGNSGVIVSQFFKGISEAFSGLEAADPAALARALESGCTRAYAAVAKPVEGTMLTVIKDSAAALSRALPLDTVDEAISVFLTEAKLSLERTPELLPILRKAGVVDSGGAGIVTFFEGVSKYLAGEDIENAESDERTEIIDFSQFTVNTRFEYGYCTEGVIQLCRDPKLFNMTAFRTALSEKADSIVLTLEGDKLKLHAHSRDLGALMRICQTVGEFLTVKIENMTVQNMRKERSAALNGHTAEKYLVTESDSECGFAIVAVASTERLQRLFAEMGADVVILSDIAPSSQDFLEAFSRIGAEEIIVFPNSSNSILSSMQAGGMYRNARVTVMNCRSAAECYAALSLIDFDEDAGSAISTAKDAISQAYEVALYHASRDVRFGSREIHKNDFFALSDKKILGVGESLETVALDVVRNTANGNYSALTVFYGGGIADEYTEHIVGLIGEAAPDIEVAALPTDDPAYSLLLLFE